MYLLGIDHLDRGSDQEALSCLYASFALQEHPKTAQKISQILYKRKQDQVAFEYLKKAYYIGENNDNIAFCYAEQLIKQGKIDKAGCILEKLLSRNHTYKKAQILLEKINIGCNN